MTTSTGMEIAGVAVIVVASLLASVLFLRRGFSRSEWDQAYESFRADLGRGIPG